MHSKQTLRDFIVQGNIRQVLRDFTQSNHIDNDLQTKAFAQSARYNEYENQKNAGVASKPDLDIALNQIIAALLALINQLPDNDIEGVLEKLHLEPRGPISLVDCNRLTPLEGFTKFYFENNNNPFQFYFLLGCPMQKPNSFAERLIYEMRTKILSEEDAMYYDRIIKDNIERVKITPIPLGLNLQTHIKAFKTYFGKLLKKHNLDTIELEQYIEQKNYQLPYNFVAFPFVIESLKWNADTSSYLNWIINTFKRNQAAQPTFVFFFVVYMNKAHIPEMVNNKVLSEIHKILHTHSDVSTLIADMPPVTEDDIAIWFRDLNVTYPSQIEDIIQLFKNHLKLKNKPIDNGHFNMGDVEDLQEKAYHIAMKI